MRYNPWIGGFSPRRLGALALAYVFLLSALLAGVVGGEALGANAAARETLVLVPCAAPAGDAGRVHPAMPGDHAGHGICALCGATGCVGGLAAAPAIAEPQFAAREERPVAVLRQTARILAVNRQARSRAPPRAA